MDAIGGQVLDEQADRITRIEGKFAPPSDQSDPSGEESASAASTSWAW